MKRLLSVAAAALLMVGTAVAANRMQAKTFISVRDGEPDYEAIIPKTFGDWTLVPSIRLVVPTETDALSNLIYSQMIGRGYVDKHGDLVMLLVAYGPRQMDWLQLHRPEVCYVAEGFRVTDFAPRSVDIGPGLKPLAAHTLVATREGRIERLTFWMRIGDDVVSTRLGQQAERIQYGLRGLVPDGALVRVSTVNLDEAKSSAVQARFIKDLIAAVGPKHLQALVGQSGAVKDLIARKAGS